MERRLGVPDWLGQEHPESWRARQTRHEAERDRIAELNDPTVRRRIG